MEREKLICEALHRADNVNPSTGKVIAKHKLMAANSFRFMRGSASLFYADLKAKRLVLPAPLEQGRLHTCIVGDCHVSNFGFFSEEGSHGDSIIFAPNDFDDACIGNACWDLLRYLVSLNLTVDYCRSIQSGTAISEDIIEPEDYITASHVELDTAQSVFLDQYVETCRLLIADKSARQKVVSQFPKGHVLRKHASKANKRAVGGKHFAVKSTLAKVVESAESSPQFAFSSSKLKRVNVRLKAAIIDTFSPYVDDDILDVAERMGAGTGSINMERYYLLVGPRDYTGIEDLGLCHIVEVKQQRVAAPVQYFEDISPVNRLNPAHLTLVCQQRMQRRPDLVLDEIVWLDKHWLVRSRHHAKVGVKPEQIGMTKESVTTGLVEYAKACGEVLALAHCRGDRRSTRFEQGVVELLPGFYSELFKLAQGYALQTAKDCQLLGALLDEAPKK